MALTTVLIVMVALAKSTSGQTFSYSNVNQWSQEFPNCAGSRQSPINIITNMTQYNASLTPLVVNWQDIPTNTSYLIRNYGGDGVMVIPQGISTSIALSGGGLPLPSYSFYQFHFHWGSRNGQGSEHQIDGMSYDMEIHLATYDSSNGQTYTEASNVTNAAAGIAVFVQVGGPDNPAFECVINYLQNVSHPNQNVTVPEFPFIGLLPTDLTNFYRYLGSYTVPYCFESAVWTIMKTPINISQAQINKFRTSLYANTDDTTLHGDQYIVDNDRPVQPLNGRTVWSSFQTTSSPSGGANNGEVLRAGSVLVLQVICLLLVQNIF